MDEGHATNWIHHVKGYVSGDDLFQKKLYQILVRIPLPDTRRDPIKSFLVGKRAAACFGSQFLFARLQSRLNKKNALGMVRWLRITQL